MEIKLNDNLIAKDCNKVIKPKNKYAAIAVEDIYAELNAIF